MAKEISGYVKLQVKGGQANPAPPVGPALGSKGVNIMEFCKQFNARTQDKQGKVVPVLITVYTDKSFDFVIKTAGGGLTVGANGTATLDGNLVVEGDNFSLQTTDLEIEDNLIVINKGETGVGITKLPRTAGIEIDRGDLPNARILFDETIAWTDPGVDENPIEAVTTEYGAFTFTNTDGELVGIKVNAIASDGETLNLIGSGTGTISVAGTVDYELNLLDDDDIPNKKYVDDAVLGTVGLKKIFSGDSSESSVEVFDQETDGLSSRIEVRADNTLTATFFEDTVELQRVEFEENRIKEEIYVDRWW